MTEITNELKLPKTLVCLEKQKYELVPEEDNQYKRKLPTRKRLVFFGEKIFARPIYEQPSSPYHIKGTHQQNDAGGETLLVAKTIRSNPKKMRQLHFV